jgi:hypothetical protein
MYTKEQLDALSGAKAYQNQQVGGAYYDTITLGKDGKFYLAHYSQPKAEREDPSSLDGAFTMTIVKIRRKLTAWMDSEKTLESVEYDAGATNILTTAGMMTEKDAKAQGAKVALVVYGLYKGNLVKMQVTGGSLYNSDDTTHLRLYSYLQSFDESESVYDAETIVGAKTMTWDSGKKDEEGNAILNTSYNMVFKRGDKIADLEVVGGALTQLATDLPENDNRDARFLGGSKPKSEVDKQFDEIGTEPIDPNSVPF